jgi:hypothetical protein
MDWRNRFARDATFQALEEQQPEKITAEEGAKALVEQVAKKKRKKPTSSSSFDYQSDY